MSADDAANSPIGAESNSDDPLRRVRLDKLEALRGMGIDPYPVGFSRTDQAAELDERSFPVQLFDNAARLMLPYL